MIKKKITEKAKAVQFRVIKPIVSANFTPPVSTVSTPVIETGNKTGAKLVIEEPKQPSPFINSSAKESAPAPTGKISSLSKIREKVAAENQLNLNKTKQLDESSLAIAWQEFILKLKTAQKNSSVTNFEMMKCRVQSPEVFQVTCTGEIELGFLKQEKTHLLDHMQSFFHNPSINFQIDFVEAVDTSNPADRPLSTKEQFMKMVEKYPLVKELKDRLGMELDY